uniref:Uncharacterized protein n=1 Tax=Rhizophora mucronata TaxID=61149 RepID=A0A2P2IJ24_RHIMU
MTEVRQHQVAVSSASCSTATFVSPTPSFCGLPFSLAYFANTTDRADLTVNSGSFFLHLLASSFSFSISTLSFTEGASTPF